MVCYIIRMFPQTYQIRFRTPIFIYIHHLHSLHSSLVKDKTLRIAAAGDYSEHPVLKIFSNDLTKNEWDPETFSDLCANALEMKDLQLLQFCDKVTQFEWKLLLDHCNAIVNPNQSGRL